MRRVVLTWGARSWVLHPGMNAVQQHRILASASAASRRAHRLANTTGFLTGSGAVAVVWLAGQILGWSALLTGLGAAVVGLALGALLASQVLASVTWRPPIGSARQVPESAARAAAHAGVVFASRQHWALWAAATRMADEEEASAGPAAPAMEARPRFLDVMDTEDMLSAAHPQYMRPSRPAATDLDDEDVVDAEFDDVTDKRHSAV